MSIDIHNHPEGKLTDLPELHRPEFDRFLPEFKRRARPVVLRGYNDHDRALVEWSFSSFAERLPDQAIDLDVGDAMVTEGLTFESDTLHNYLHDLADNARPSGEPVRYLQGFDIFGHDPTLHEEISFPHLESVAARSLRAGWIGPAGTVTGYHADIADNQLSQIVGRKLVKLISPDQSQKVYRHKKYDPNGIACAVDADNWDQQAHPLFATANAFFVVLDPGDSVFIPGKWFHYVRSLDASISVNQLGYTRSQLAIGKSADQVRRFLHNRGLYGDTCTCHMLIDGVRVARR